MRGNACGFCGALNPMPEMRGYYSACYCRRFINDAWPCVKSAVKIDVRHAVPIGNLVPVLAP